MEVLAIILGLGAVAVSPFVPGLRPAAKTVVAGGIALGATVATAVAVAGEQWKDLVAEAQAEHAAVEEAKANITETIIIPQP
jgi:hypothetical protein